MSRPPPWFWAHSGSMLAGSDPSIGSSRQGTGGTDTSPPKPFSGKWPGPRRLPASNEGAPPICSVTPSPPTFWRPAQTSQHPGVPGPREHQHHRHLRTRGIPGRPLCPEPHRRVVLQGALNPSASSNLSLLDRNSRSPHRAPHPGISGIIPGFESPPIGSSPT